MSNEFEHPLSRARTARINKDRSRRQEQKIASYLKGRRVPMSGSGTMKGDIRVPFDDYRDIYGECKFTEKDTLSVQVAWLEKIRTEAHTERCLFGILVISFYRHSNNYILISPEGTRILRTHLGDQIFDAIPMLATAYEGKAFSIGRSTEVRRYIQTKAGIWLHTGLPVFREWLESIASQSHEN
jgi:hypothetical protein